MINTFYNENCADTMLQIEDKYIDGIITSPPYNINTERSDLYYNNGYSDLDNLTEEEYLTIRTNEFQEFSRIIKKTGRVFICLDAVKDGETKEMYMGDPTHVNIQPIDYWYKLFAKHGFMFDVEAYNKFVRSKYKPTADKDTNFFNEYPYWSVWILQKT